MHSIKPNDYGYASSGCRGGEQTLNNYDSEICRSTNWLFNGDFKLLFSPSCKYNHYVIRVYSFGYVNITYTLSAYNVYPTTYLTSTIKITSGDGTKENPYQLSL